MEANFTPLTHKEECPFNESAFQERITSNMTWGAKLKGTLEEERRVEEARSGGKKERKSHKKRDDGSKSPAEVASNPFVLQYLKDQQDMINKERGDYFNLCDCFGPSEKVKALVIRPLASATKEDFKRINDPLKKVTVMEIFGDVSDSSDEAESSAPCSQEHTPQKQQSSGQGQSLSSSYVVAGVVEKDDDENKDAETNQSDDEVVPPPPPNADDEDIYGGIMEGPTSPDYRSCPDLDNYDFAFANSRD